LAMSRPDVAFTLAGEERPALHFAAVLGDSAGRLVRLGDVLGAEFRANAVGVAAEREEVRIEGFVALPTLTRANSLGQYLFVNGRPVRDRLLLGAVRAAYADYLPRDRHPLLTLFVSLPPSEVDVNVHPAKAEVRFRNAGLVRALIVHALKSALAREATRAATTGGAATIPAFRGAARLGGAGHLGWRARASRGGKAAIAGAMSARHLRHFMAASPRRCNRRLPWVLRRRSCTTNWTALRIRHSNNPATARCSTIRSGRRGRKF